MSELLLKINATEAKKFKGKIELRDLQIAVGGIIEIFNLTNSIMIVNEEGLLKGLPYNILASSISGVPIVGDAVLLTNESVRKLK